MDRHTVEDEIVSTLASEICNEIDKDVISTILESEGWTPVTTANHKQKHGEGMDKWLDANCKGQWAYAFNRVIFELQQDAIWFALTWN